MHFWLLKNSGYNLIFSFFTKIGLDSNFWHLLYVSIIYLQVFVSKFIFIYWRGGSDFYPNLQLRQSVSLVLLSTKVYKDISSQTGRDKAAYSEVDTTVLYYPVSRIWPVYVLQNNGHLPNKKPSLPLKPGDKTSSILFR